MSRTRAIRGTAALALALATAGLVGSNGPAATAIDWTPVGAALGVQGKVQADGVYRIGLPRTDLHVHLDGVTLEPSFALGSYLAFVGTGSGSNAIMMGDLVLTDDEIAPVMTKLEQGGIDVTALHNHLFGEKPEVLYMHVMGSGDAVQLATAARAELLESNTPLEGAPARPGGKKAELDTAALDAAIGAAGKLDGDIYKFTIAPKYPVQEDGVTLPASTGVATALAFEPLGHGDAAITGDFALTAAQVNPVSAPCARTESWLPRCTATCSTRHRPSFSCTSSRKATR